MRLRNVRGARQTIASSKHIIDQPDSLKGKWQERFSNNNPIHIEIGMGKGQFITNLAINNPNINYIGIEKYSSVLVRALEKLDEREDELSNLILLRFEAEYLTDIFEDQEIEPTSPNALLPR